MENEESNTNQTPRVPNQGRKVLGGAIVITIGIFLLLKEQGLALPEWLFSWEMLLIVIGFYVGVKHRFRNPSWIILMVIGGVFLIDDVFPGTSVGSYIWPVAIILVGIAMMFKPHRPCQDRDWKRWEHKWKDKWEWENANRESSGDDMIETVSIFAGVKKKVISKNFRGGEVTCVFGGVEVNLMQADIQGKAVLELTQVFGGTKLIVPANWEIQNHDLVAVMGGIEDKRPVTKEATGNPDKILVLRGTCLFGGIEINSYS